MEHDEVIYDHYARTWLCCMTKNTWSKKGHVRALHTAWVDSDISLGKSIKKEGKEKNNSGCDVCDVWQGFLSLR